MKIVQLIENKRTKLVIFAVGFLITLAALFGSIYGLVLGYAGITEGEPWLIILGVVTILALLGIFGAWLRYSNNLSTMSQSKRTKTRFFLICGIVAGVYLAVGTIYIGGWPEGLFFFLLTFSAGVYLYATPKEF